VTKVPQTLERDLGLQQFFSLTGAMGQFEGLSMLPIQASLLEAGSHHPSDVAHLQRYIHKNEQTMFNIKNNDCGKKEPLICANQNVCLHVI
jgi:hypothetical protein